MKKHNLNRETLSVNGYSWDHDSRDPMLLIVKFNGDIIMRLSMHEAIQYAGRSNILNIVKEYDDTPWLTEWQAEKHQELIGILKQ